MIEVNTIKTIDFFLLLKILLVILVWNRTLLWHTSLSLADTEKTFVFSIMSVYGWLWWKLSIDLILFIFITILNLRSSSPIIRFSRLHLVYTELTYVSLSWSANSGTMMCRSPQEKIIDEFLLNSPAVLYMFCLSNINALWDGR